MANNGLASELVKEQTTTRPIPRLNKLSKLKSLGFFHKRDPDLSIFILIVGEHLQTPKCYLLR